MIVKRVKEKKKQTKQLYKYHQEVNIIKSVGMRFKPLLTAKIGSLT